MLFRSPFFLSQTLEPVNSKHFSSLLCWYLCLQTDMENGHKREVQVAPSLSSSFQKQGSIPQVANREVMLEALKLSAELSVGRKRDFKVVSSCFLSCLAFKMSTFLLRTGGGEQQECAKITEREWLRLQRSRMNKWLAMGCNSSSWSSETDLAFLSNRAQHWIINYYVRDTAVKKTKPQTKPNKPPTKF